MRIVEVAYNDNFHGNIFEEAQHEIAWHPLAEEYDSWTAQCLALAQNMGFNLLEADFAVQEPNCVAPPTRYFKLTNPNVAHYLLVVPLMGIFCWVNEDHTETIHPDIVLFHSLNMPGRVIVDDTKGSVIQIDGGPTIIDPRNQKDRKPTRKYK